MNMELYNKISFQFSKILTRKYSTSFSLGIYMLEKRFHKSIYAIYGFVRLADEIVDTFHAYDKEKLFKRFCEDTQLALENKISTNPILNSFQITAHEFSIDYELINAFLKSMEMDLSISDYNENRYSEYIYGSAEVVGLMCLKVFCQDQPEEYKKLISPAKNLGAAFQKVNFLRDLNSDYKERGRVYFPGVNFTEFTPDQKSGIEADIDKDFNDSWQGIIKLPNGSKLGVMVAYIYYKALFKKIKLLPVHKIKSQRIRISNFEKLILLLKTWLRIKLNLV